MAEIKVECGYCGHAFAAREEDVGNSVQCAACGRPTLVVAEGEPLDSSKLQLKTEAGAGTTRKDCPACGAAADEEATVCIHCGYNWMTGQLHKQQVKMTSGRWKQFVPYVLVALIAGSVGYLVGTRQSGAVSLPGSTPIVFEKPERPEPEDRSPGTGTEKAQEAAEAAAAAQVQDQTAGMSEDAAEEETEGLDEERIAEFESRYRDRLHAQLDQTQPTFDKNAAIAVIKSNGMVLRGTYLGVKGDVLVLAQEKDILEIPLKELSRETRIRCDDKFREFVVEQKVKAQMRQIREQ